MQHVDFSKQDVPQFFRVGNSKIPQDDIYRYSTKLTLPKSGMPIQVELLFTGNAKEE